MHQNSLKRNNQEYQEYQEYQENSKRTYMLL